MEEREQIKAVALRPNKRPKSPVSEDPGHDDGDDGFEEWGTSKQNYYNQEEIETEGDALEEEAETRRLQQKRLKGMSEADFGFDDKEWLTAGKVVQTGEPDDGSNGAVVTEVLPQPEITDAMEPQDRLKFLNTRYPEFDPLSKEFLRLQSLYVDLGLEATRAATTVSDVPSSGTGENGHYETPIVVVKFQALSAYLGALSMYFALFTSPSQDGHQVAAAMSPAELREHPIMESLVNCQQLWNKLEDIKVAIPSMKSAETNKKLVKIKPANGHETRASYPNGIVDTDLAKSEKRIGKAKKQPALEAARAEAERRRVEKAQKTEEELAELSKLPTLSATWSGRYSEKARSKSGIQIEDYRSDIGEEDFLDPIEAAEKARRKKSLRFYTSNIAQKVNRRDQAGKDAGGDADLPYRERLKDRQARLNAQAEKRGKKDRNTNAALDMNGSSSDDDNQSKPGRKEDAENEEDYYQYIASASRQKKEEKKAGKASSREKLGVYDVDMEGAVGLDGKRAINYMIEKNKGLAPKRKKDVRNPRVKKRKKFAEKQKKLGSMRQVYKGGESREGYGGEATGIKTRLVKSVKL